MGAAIAGGTGKTTTFVDGAGKAYLPEQSPNTPKKKSSKDPTSPLKTFLKYANKKVSYEIGAGAEVKIYNRKADHRNERQPGGKEEYSRQFATAHRSSEAYVNYFYNFEPEASLQIIAKDDDIFKQKFSENCEGDRKSLAKKTTLRGSDNNEKVSYRVEKNTKAAVVMHFDNENGSEPVQQLKVVVGANAECCIFFSSEDVEHMQVKKDVVYQIAPNAKVNFIFGKSDDVVDFSTLLQDDSAATENEKGKNGNHAQSGRRASTDNLLQAVGSLSKEKA